MSKSDSVVTKLPGYFSGEISEEDRATVNEWREESPGNEKEFQELKFAWDAMPLLQQMERSDQLDALRKVHTRIDSKSGKLWFLYFQRAAAILFFPLVAYTGFLWFKSGEPAAVVEVQPVWQTISTPPGVKSCFYLPDSSRVWLNSSSSIIFPERFEGNVRQAAGTGEAFFDIRKDESKPFWLSLGKMHVKVLGTRFDVINYSNEATTEVALESGKVELCTGSFDHPALLTAMNPGELALYSKAENSIHMKEVDVRKYSAWITGKLVFKDDPMEEVVRKLNHWFNVNIEVADPEILGYVYTATFQDESIDQILELLTLSAPIRYQIIQREKKGDMFSARRIILKKI